MTRRGKNPLYTKPTAFGENAVSAVWEGGPGRQLEKVSYSGCEFLYRPQCCDEHTLVDVAKRRYYERYRTVKADDVWLDAGANIGAFSVVASGVAKAVIAVEPEPTNFAILLKNLELNNRKNVVPLRAALVADETTMVTLYQNVTGNTGSHSLYVKRGRPSLKVQALNTAALIKRYGVNCVKMDVEGAELEIVPTLSLSSLRTLVMEYHFNACRDRDHSAFREMVMLLSEHFPNVRYSQNLNKWSWWTLVHCWR